jgi:uncharacterized phage-associated protein
MDIAVLIATIAKKYREKIGVAPAKTKLLKLVYLAEVYFARLTNERLTSQEWVFWKFGPYFREYNEVLSDTAIFIPPAEVNDFYPVEVRDDYDTKEPPLNEFQAIARALDHAGDDLNQILDFVYFDTEPMMEVSSRGDKLNFECVKPEEFYTVKRYSVDKKQGESIARKIREWEKRKSR